MSMERREGESGNAIGEMSALRWKPTHVTKYCPRSIPLQARHRFKLQKLERPLMVKNVDGTVNSRGAIMHQVECNVFYKRHVERM